MNSPLAGLHLQNVNTAKLLKFRWPARAQMRGKQSFPLISRPVPIGRRAKKNLENDVGGAERTDRKTNNSRRGIVVACTLFNS